MTQAAVPAYLGQDFSDAPPGHRFTLYFPAWTSDWKPVEKDAKRDAAKAAAQALTVEAKAQLQRLISRQAEQIDKLAKTGGALETFDARSTAPFATGLGLEHPLENGFAFLNPYGLPYLPGSSVKGVLRASARELASGDWGGKAGWDHPAIESLFGSLPEAEPLKRGALTFWDVIPKIERMAVDVMTPHQGHYYQNGQSPHDSGQPIPIPFLVVPPGVPFTFHVLCDEKRLDEALKSQWRAMLQVAFRHAFEWLGFGAKTAVGYGAMRDVSAERKQQREIERIEREEAARKQQEELDRLAGEAAEKARLEALSPGQRQLDALVKKLAEPRLQTAQSITPRDAVHAQLEKSVREAVAPNSPWQMEEKAQLADLLTHLVKSERLARQSHLFGKTKTLTAQLRSA